MMLEVGWKGEFLYNICEHSFTCQEKNMSLPYLPLGCVHNLLLLVFVLVCYVSPQTVHHLFAPSLSQAKESSHS